MPSDTGLEMPSGCLKALQRKDLDPCSQNNGFRLGKRQGCFTADPGLTVERLKCTVNKRRMSLLLLFLNVEVLNRGEVRHFIGRNTQIHINKPTKLSKME